MKQRVKWLFCAMLAVVAMLCLTATLAKLGVPDIAARKTDEYLVRGYEGLVYVYRLPDTRKPLYVLESAADALNAARRAELALGMRAADDDELREILEDIKS